MKHENRKSLSAPKRPPQPKLTNFEKKEKEGMLIDLTSPQQQDVSIPALISNTFDSAFVSKLNDMSLLDAPIDVPTEEYPDDELNAVGLFDNESNKPEPPPYQSPPTYMNTFALNKSTSKYASSSTVASSQYGNLHSDPFDTSHIVPSQSTTMSSHVYSVDDSSGKFIRNQIQTTSCKDFGYMSQPTAKSEIDEIVENKLSSLSPKIGQRASSLTACSSLVLNSDNIKQVEQYSTEPPLKSSENSTLNDSLQVNLSSLTLNVTEDNDTHIQPSTSIDQNPKLDRAFLAELEKEMYKDNNAASNVNVNNAQTNDLTSNNTKENSVSAISSSLNWLKNDFGVNNDVTSQIYQQNSTGTLQSPAKYNEPVKMTNSESASTHMTLSKKLYNAEINSADPSHALSSSQMGTNNVMTMNSSNQAIYSNYSMTGNYSNSAAIGPLDQQKYNFVTSTNQLSTNINNIYSVASDIYGSSTGANVYDVVASNNSDYYQTIQPNDVQSVIYDEVAADVDIRPHRPAPGPPILSAQQIQRRLERAQKEQFQQLYGNLESNYVNDGFSNESANQSVYEEIHQKLNTLNSCNDVSKDTLNAANIGTIKNMKIEQLLR